MPASTPTGTKAHPQPIAPSRIEQGRREGRQLSVDAVYMYAVPATTFALVERAIASCKSVTDVLLGWKPAGDANGERGMQSTGQFVDGRAYRLGERANLRELEVLQHSRELITAVPGHDCAPARPKRRSVAELARGEATLQRPPDPAAYAISRIRPEGCPGRLRRAVGKVYDGIDRKLEAWISEQPLFFVATAPLSEGGHVNVSPKGPAGAFRVLGPRRVAYIDVVGSGAETLAHLRENGRIVVMFCAFAGPPRIVRLHGKGTVAQIGAPCFEDLKAIFDLESLQRDGLDEVDLRSVIEVDVSRVADSCGYGVPLMRFEGQRPQGRAWVENRLRTHGANALMDYSRELNAASIDGLPGIDPELLPQRS